MIIATMFKKNIRMEIRCIKPCTWDGGNACGPFNGKLEIPLGS